VVLEQHGREADRLLRRDGAVGRSLEDQPFEVRRLAETGGLHPVVDPAHRTVGGVDRYPADAHRLVEVTLGRDVSPAAAHLDLHLEVALLIDRGDVHVRVHDLDLAVLGEVGSGHRPGALDVDREHLGLVGVEPDRHLLQVEHHVGHVLDHARDRRELVEHALDVDRGDRRALYRRQQTTAHGVADGGGEAPLEGLSEELGIGGRRGLAVNLEALGALEILPVHMDSLLALVRPDLDQRL
jgi:hypothetical protein